jgi:hypothetical protein
MAEEIIIIREVKVLYYLNGGVTMVKVELETSTLAVLVAGPYSIRYNIDAMAIPQSVYLQIAEKLEFFLPDWDYDKISFEEWINTSLMIYPKVLFAEEDIEDMKNNTLYWEVSNGNAVLVVSMDVSVINGG